MFTIYGDKATGTEWTVYFPTASSKMQTCLHMKLFKKIILKTILIRSQTISPSEENLDDSFLIFFFVSFFISSHKICFHVDDF